LIFEGHRAPRKICVIDDSLAVVTDLYDHSVSFFNPVSLKIIRENVPVGPAPEGVDCFNGFIYVANSGYGDYLATYPKAGYISILNTFSMSEIKTVYSGPDLIEVLVNRKNNRLYAAYINLPSKPDSFGGIVEYNLETLKETNRWLTHPKSLNLTSTGDTLLFLTKTGVSLIDLTPKNPVPTEILTNPSSTDIWYSLIYCALNNTIWIGNSKNYQTKGEISVYSFSTTPVFLKKFETGINPGKIVFY